MSLTRRRASSRLSATRRGRPSTTRLSSLTSTRRATDVPYVMKLIFSLTAAPPTTQASMRGCANRTELFNLMAAQVDVATDIASDNCCIETKSTFEQFASDMMQRNISVGDAMKRNMSIYNELLQRRDVSIDHDAEDYSVSAPVDAGSDDEAEDQFRHSIASRTTPCCAAPAPSPSSSAPRSPTVPSGEPHRRQRRRRADAHACSARPPQPRLCLYHRHNRLPRLLVSPACRCSPRDASFYAPRFRCWLDRAQGY